MAETKKKTTRPTAKKASTSRAPKKATTPKTAEKNTSVSADMKASDSSASSTPFKIEIMSKRTKITLLVVIVLVILGIILYMNRGLFIAATVNGQPIPRLSVISALEQQSGAQVLNGMIDRELILQEAQNQNITIEQSEIDARRKEIIEQISGGNEENFNQVLSSQGLTPEKFNEELRVQLIAEKLLGERVTVTDEEFEEFLSSNPDLLENSENEEQDRETFRTQLEQQKLQAEYQTWMTELRNNAQIERIVTY